MINYLLIRGKFDGKSLRKKKRKQIDEVQKIIL